MSESYYIRIRGRVQGPFDEQKLQALVKRGQFSRMHEISPDGIQWTSASTHPQLFAASPTRKAPEKAVANPQSASHSAPTPSAPPADWYFTFKGKRQGPVGWDELKENAQAHRIGPNDLVWNGTMPDWQPAGEIDGLFPRTFFEDRAPPVGRDETTRSSGDAVGPAARTLEDSLGTLMFLAVWCDVMGALFALSCLVTLIAPDEVNGVTRGSATATALLVILPMAAIFITGGVLLHKYRSRIVEMLRYRDVERLDQALRALNSFWWFVGLVMAIVTIMFVGLMFLAFSASSVGVGDL